jgi:hypothetical protein
MVAVPRIHTLAIAPQAQAHQGRCRLPSPPSVLGGVAGSQGPCWRQNFDLQGRSSAASQFKIASQHSTFQRRPPFPRAFCLRVLFCKLITADLSASLQQGCPLPPSQLHAAPLPHVHHNSRPPRGFPTPALSWKSSNRLDFRKPPAPCLYARIAYRRNGTSTISAHAQTRLGRVSRQPR